LLALNKVSKKLNHDNDVKLFTKPNREKRRTKKPPRIKKEYTPKKEKKKKRRVRPKQGKKKF
jgi:hypothetical protein